MNADIQRAIDAAVQKAIAPLKTDITNRNKISNGMNSYIQAQFPAVMTSIRNQHDTISKQDKINKQLQSDIRALHADNRDLHAENRTFKSKIDKLESDVRKLQQRINKYDLILDARQHVTTQGFPRRLLPGANDAKKKIKTLGKMQTFAHAGNVNEKRRSELKGSLDRAIKRRSAPKNSRGNSSNSFGSANSNILKNANTIYKTVKRK